MDIILIQPQSKEQFKAFEQMAKALKVPFHIQKESPYKSEFVAMVKQADIDYKNGKGKKIKLDDIWK